MQGTAKAEGDTGVTLAGWEKAGKGGMLCIPPQYRTGESWASDTPTTGGGAAGRGFNAD